MTWHLWILGLAVGGTFLLIIWAVFFGREEEEQETTTQLDMFDDGVKHTKEYYDRDRNR